MAAMSAVQASAAVQPCFCRDVETPSKRTAGSVAAFSGLGNAAKYTPLSSCLGDSAAAQRDALRRSAYGSSSSVTSGGRKAVVCMAGEVGTSAFTRLLLEFLTHLFRVGILIDICHQKGGFTGLGVLGFSFNLVLNFD